MVEVSIGDFVLTGGEPAAQFFWMRRSAFWMAWLAHRRTGRGEFFIGSAGIPPVHPTTGLAGQISPRCPSFRPPCQHCGVAAGAGGTGNGSAQTGSVGMA